MGVITRFICNAPLFPAVTASSASLSLSLPPSLPPSPIRPPSGIFPRFRTGMESTTATRISNKSSLPNTIRRSPVLCVFCFSISVISVDSVSALYILRCPLLGSSLTCRLIVNLRLESFTRMISLKTRCGYFCPTTSGLRGFCQLCNILESDVYFYPSDTHWSHLDPRAQVARANREKERERERERESISRSSARISRWMVTTAR